MPHESQAVEDLKIANEAGWAAIGRGIADAAQAGHSVTILVGEARMRRLQEQRSAERSTRFAALAREIGDATSAGRDTAPYIQRLVDLRHAEVGPAVTAS